MNTKIILCSILLALFAQRVEALEVFGNGGDRTGSGTTTTVFSLANGLAIPFTTGDSTTLNRLVRGAWVLVGENTSSDAGFDVRIYNDLGTNQGPSGSAVVSASSTRLQATGSSWIFVDFGTPVQLTANSNYYLAVIKTSGTANQFGWTTPTLDPIYSDLASGSNYALTSGGSVTTYGTTNLGTSWFAGGAVSSALYGFQIVPEPSTYALGAVATLTMGILGLRRRALTA